MIVVVAFCFKFSFAESEIVLVLILALKSCLINDCHVAAVAIWKAFFYLRRKHFPPSNKLHKICNKNIVKLSYSCTHNMANILAAHNKRILKSHNGKSESKPCNCRYKPSCPLNGNCRDMAIVYQATFQSKDQYKNYFGLCKTEFKTKCYNHNHSFNSDFKRNATELYKFI